ncbi:hypothetical protein PG988_005649 [Apiospora saccharicola]
MDSTLGIIGGTVLAAVIGSFMLDDYFVFRHVEGEPVYAQPDTPLVGHILGMRDGSGYFDKVGAKLKSGVFTLPIFNFKIYVVMERALFAPIQRAARTISFNPLIKKANKAFAKLSQKSLDQYDDDSFWHDFRKISVQGMAPGADLDRLNLETVQGELRHVQELAAQSLSAPDEPVSIDLNEWIQHLLSQSATTGLYGPMNPFKDPEHEKSFWDFYANATDLFVDFLPSFLVGKARKAQAANGARYEAYLRSNGHETASAAIQLRTSFFTDRGLTPRENAWMNLAYDVGILANFTPTAFWTVYNAISRPELLAAIREELVTKSAVSRSSNSDDGKGTYTLDLARLRTACPLLLSTFQETQRLITNHAPLREILTDTTIKTDDKKTSYLFKKGNYLKLPSMPILHDQAIWGGDADEFDPHRFLKMKKDDSGDAVTHADLPPSAFPVWGVAPHICPARQYASTGVLALVALLAMRFDFEQEGVEGGEWKAPEAKGAFAFVLLPAETVKLRVKAREGWNEGDWEVAVGEAGTRMRLAVPG